MPCSISAPHAPAAAAAAPAAGSADRGGRWAAPGPRGRQRGLRRRPHQRRPAEAAGLRRRRRRPVGPVRAGAAHDAGTVPAGVGRSVSHLSRNKTAVITKTKHEEAKCTQ